QIRGYIVVPIFASTKLWGLLCAYQHSGPRNWQEWEANLLKRLGDQLGVALHHNQLIEKLRQASEEADSANKAKNLFLANMSHELRTPLNAILGFTQVLRRQKDLTPLQQNHLDIISRAGQHLLVLLNDVLTMSKIEANHIQLQTEYFSLDQMVTTLADIFRLQAQKHNIDFVAELAPDTPNHVCGDQGKLQQVIINLLSNAFKFTERGQISLKVWGEVMAQGTTNNEDDAMVSLHCQVRDTGLGIAPEELDVLFDPFVQTASGKKIQEGTGLGLAISKRFIELMGGAIEVQSKLEQGSCFEFFVTLKIAPPSQIHHGFSRVKAIAPGQPEYRILVVDDQMDSRLALRYLLESFGFRVAEAENGLEAIDELQRWQPHLIWMDLEMPRMNGYEAIHTIRTILNNHQVKIIAITAHIFEDKKQQIQTLGCDDFAIKPFMEEQILSILSDHLGVKYIQNDHESEPPHALLTADPTTPVPISTEDLWPELQGTDPFWRKQLRQAAMAARESHIVKLIAEIKDPKPVLGAYLQQLQQQLAFEAIVKLLAELEDSL
ncbi:MAG: response regulator, partial [Synechococcaceae cyanobacterium RL_1_2]|nr:response regulator [Synechococcaceae cyanobacterium RL_1_2]